MRISHDKPLYIEALVYEIKSKLEDSLNLPPQFLVKSLHDESADKIWTKRTQLRILLPPWWEELQHLGFLETSPSSTLHRPTSSALLEHYESEEDDLKKEDISFTSASTSVGGGSYYFFLYFFSRQITRSCILRYINALASLKSEF